MIPLRDTIPARHPPVMMWCLMALNLLVFLFELGLPPAGLEEFLHLWGIVPRRLLQPEWAAAAGFPGPGWATLVSSMFLHGGWLHFIGNMWTLWIFGDNVEDRMGPLRFLLFYLATGVLAGATHVLTNPTSMLPTIGASGAIAGVLGAYLVLYPHARVLTLVPILFYVTFVELPAVVFMGVWFLIQLGSGMAALAGPAHAGGVAWWAHLGGFGAGVVVHRLFLSKRRRPRTRRMTA